MNYLVDQQGRAHDLKMSWPAGIPAQAQQMMAGMSQSLESMVAPLPKEPIGLGATWQVIGRAARERGGPPADRHVHAEGAQGHVISSTSAFDQLAANDEVAPPGMPKIAKAKLVSFDAKGSGSSVLDTKDVAPVGGSLAMTTACRSRSPCRWAARRRSRRRRSTRKRSCRTRGPRSERRDRRGPP